MRLYLLVVLFVLLAPRLGHAASAGPVNAVLKDASWSARHGEPPAHDASEVDRIQTHLAYVEARLRDAEPPGLDRAQRGRRQQALEALTAYRRAGRFPHRTDDVYPGRRPRFIDDRGVHCAVGALIAATGHPALARAINRDHEYAYIADIDEPALRAWAHAFGLTRRELAMIQPTYGHWRTSLSAREAQQRVTRSVVEREALQCAREHQPSSHVKLRVETRYGGLRATTDTRDPFARCFVSRVHERLWDEREIDEADASTYPLEMSISIDAPQQLLHRSVVEAELADSRCTPRPGAIPKIVGFDVRVGAKGVQVDTQTLPRNLEVERCLSSYMKGELWRFGPGRWSPAIRDIRSLAPRVNDQMLHHWVRNDTPSSVALDCKDVAASRSSFVVEVSAEPEAAELEVDVRGGTREFGACMRASLQHRLHMSLMVARSLPDRSKESYFRIDGAARARVEFAAPTDHARSKKRRPGKKRRHPRPLSAR